VEDFSGGMAQKWSWISTNSTHFLSLLSEALYGGRLEMFAEGLRVE